jgi:hypothetical protein
VASVALIFVPFDIFTELFPALPLDDADDDVIAAPFPEA